MSMVGSNILRQQKMNLSFITVKTFYVKMRRSMKLRSGNEGGSLIAYGNGATKPECLQFRRN